MFDYIICHGLIYNGLNEPPVKNDIGVRGDRIVAIAPNLPREGTKKLINAQGLIVAPGFIDSHASTGLGYYFPDAARHKLYQGITTEVIGNCGTSTAPVGLHLVPTMQRLSKEMGFPFNWRTLQEYFETLAGNLQFNIATLVGHSTLRKGFLTDWHRPTLTQVGQMKKALEQALEEGALGLSSGLIYAPGCFAKTKELVELAKVTERKGGVYASHIRDERDQVEEAVEEALKIGEQANIPVLVSHLKAAERKNWGKIKPILQRLDLYNANHEKKVAIDVYPYTATSTKLRAFIPKSFLAEGIPAVPKKLKEKGAIQKIEAWLELKGYDLTQMIIISKDVARYVGKSIAEIAAESKQSMAETIAEVLITNTEIWIVYHCINEQDMDEAILWKQAMICSDSWSYPINAPNPIGEPHPRSYGAFTAFLERYVLIQKSLSWEEAIHKITDLPARFFNLQQRGQIKKGYFADLVVLDPKNLKTNADYLHPRRLSDGVKHVLVNGHLVIDNGQLTKINGGRFLKR